jgi:hypothetical protein
MVHTLHRFIMINKTTTKRPSSAGTPAKLSDILDDMADKLMQRWVQENSKKLWLGGPSRKAVQADIAALLRKSYDLAKERYSKG